ncbi:type II toxin-antitoxin system RatA family toxin [Yinghuangia seranimata]|uniref:type II toxin-antitoxin system RatA family toxin n=1 Tax=Yinghuangia seranimata TaxID=408067 RepID=UPI00248A9926|nr:SRPBCC family protein [Yinghuangia seranimata]MDI2132301.1 SRPBCC family protein [Yinghuangia seranimata]
MECSVVLDARLPGRRPDDAFALVADFERYPELTDNVRNVTVRHSSSDGLLDSTWEVTFRRGILIWSERDHLDPAARVIEFTQTKGDFAKFTGTWRIDETPDGSLVTFTSRFDLGIASLASLVDPVACAAMRDGITDILKGLFGKDTEVREIEAAPIG